MGERPIFPPVPMPVDVSDKERFPEFERARQHLRKLRKEKNNDQ